MKKISLILILSIMGVVSLNAQEDDSLLQFSGLVLTSDSLIALPSTNVYIKDVGRGTVTNAKGFFSLIAQPGDTIVFSSVGYKRKHYGIPRDLKQKRYSIIQLMTQDTINLDETVVYPWPSPRQFKEAFISLNIPDDQMERARKNLEREKMQEISRHLPRDPNENLDMYAREQAAEYYHYGQVPPMNIFNPISWAKFFKAWKDGEFKKKD